MSHIRFMQMAIDKALEGVKSGQSPFGACIVRNGEVISCEHNIVLASCDITAHAEINAIRKACKNLQTIDLAGCEIFSTCEPCPMCFAAIHWARIGKIYFGASISDAENFGFNELKVSNIQLKEFGRSKIEIVPEIMKKQCIELFEYWNSRPDKKTY